MHAITERLAELQSWRARLSSQIVAVTDFLRMHDFLTQDTEAALSGALAQVASQKVTVAFIAEVARGKSELINSLFFTDLGRQLLPSGPGKGTRCVTELRFDRDMQTSVRLLPIETRESPKRFDDLLKDNDLWHSVPFDADSPDSTARALAALSETKRISLSDAVAWGLHGEGVAVPAGDNNATLVDVPRWRHAIINYPHPLLDAGLVIIDTPGLAALISEPELARQRVPSADALILVLDVTAGVTKPDLEIWRDHLGNARHFRDREKEGSTQLRIIVLNKIDELRIDETLGPVEANHARLLELDHRVRDVADLLRIDPIRVIPVSARLALHGKLANDTDMAIRSRLYQLERGLATNLPRDRQVGMYSDIVAMLSAALETAQETLDSDRFETLENLQNLSLLREKNEKLAASVSSQTNLKHDHLEAAMRELKSIKSVHSMLAENLSTIVDVTSAKLDAASTRRALVSNVSPGKTYDIIKQYFSVTRAKLVALESKIDEVRSLYSRIGERMRQDFHLMLYDVHPFATQRFYSELQKAQDKAEAEFTKTSNLLLRRGSALAEQFDELIASRVLHIFEIASRESATWVRGLYVSVERPLEALKNQTLGHSANVEKFKSAELDLAERIAEIQAHLDVAKRKHAALADARAGLERFTGKSRAQDAADQKG
ncbi:MAG: dynamin family protein [Betaproteobacteria bacterium]|nr:dynamin family protein [Betaproteobacteria bacterium]